MVVEKSKYPSRHKVREFTRPTITLQDVLRQWYKVLWIWWGSFGTKYDHHTSLSFFSNNHEWYQKSEQIHRFYFRARKKMWATHAVQFFSSTKFCIVLGCDGNECKLIL